MKLPPALKPSFGIAAGLLVLMMIWHFGVTWSGIPRYILPGPKAVLTCLWQERDQLRGHVRITLIETVTGMILGVLIGSITAISMVAVPPLRRVLYPAMIISQALPVFALAPMLVLWFGYGMASKIAMAVLILYFPVCATLYHGLSRINRQWHDQARIMNAHPWHRFWIMDLPASMPVLAAGLNIAAITAPIGAIIGEWVGSSGGLGYLMMQSNARMKTDLMFAALLVLAVMALGIFGVTALINRHLTRWEHL